MKTNFNNYSFMPVNSEGKKNNWFNNVIKKHDLDIENDYVVLINSRNSRIIEKAINLNESYNTNFTLKMYEYYCNKFHNNFPKYGDDSIEPLTDLIRMIDLENSTNIWRYKQKRIFIKNMVSYISNPIYNFWDELKEGNVKLIDKLRASSGSITNGPKSLASKICKYFSEMFFNKDNYYINDTVIRHVLPYYLNFYKMSINKKTSSYFDSLNYEQLFYFMEQLRFKSDPSLSRSQIDHIMWYCYRFE